MVAFNDNRMNAADAAIGHGDIQRSSVITLHDSAIFSLSAHLPNPFFAEHHQ
jgi:hypothetical protein